jgi:site-specific recombinase XerD
VIAQFEQSTEFAEKSKDTRRDYAYCARTVREYRTNDGKGPTLDTLYVDRLSLPAIQRLIESIAKGRQDSRPGAGDAVPGYPSKANHLLRYFRVLFGWGMRHGHCNSNPAQGAKQVRERKKHGMPTHDAYELILEFARERGARKAHSEGSSPAYLWPLLEIQYLCRMRTIEVVALTEAHSSEQGLYVARRKGSNDNVVSWTPRLSAAWDTALAVRAATLARPGNKGRPVPIRAEQRFIFLSGSGRPLSRSGLNTIWHYLIRAAIDAGVITQEQRFTL